ncbi:MAG: hypothetical protein LBR36_09700, partial [Bacteroidales bacterium]|nr:hypothetical protein [Bacteroidales bacterium]
MFRTSSQLLSILAGMILSLTTGFAQYTQFAVENFDGGTVSYTPSSGTAWVANNSFYTSYPNSYRAAVPSTAGTTVYLESPTYNLSAYSNVFLRFKHICKVSPLDTVWIEYKIAGQGWLPIANSAYLGSAANYSTGGFSAASYRIWQASDSTVVPQQSWWQTESFDVSLQVGSNNAAQFRFALKKGATAGTNASYGWLLDDIEILHCNGGLSGRFTIGTTGDFSSISMAFNRLSTCGVSGNITLAFQSGTYPNSNIDLTNISTLMGGYKLTITSDANNADSVILQLTSGNG